MPEKLLNSVDRAARELYEKGSSALQRSNLDYAIMFFTQALQKEPGFLDCRIALRTAQLKKFGSNTGFFKKVFGTAGASPLLAKGQFALRKNPLEAIEAAEQILTSDPNNSHAHRLMAEAALAADFPKTALLSLDFLYKASPGDADLGMKLALALASAGHIAKAESHMKELLRVNPSDPRMLQAVKDISARRTLSEGGYEALSDGKGSYRDILRNKEESITLEQEKREVKDEDVALRLITEYEAQVINEPGNTKLLRKIAELYTQRKDFDRAIEYYERIISTVGVGDPGLEQALTEAISRKYDHLISQIDPASPDATTETARLSTEKQEFVLKEFKNRVERYPSDLALRFDYGVLLFHAQKTGDAIAEFQKAQNNPHKRVSALGYLAQCFARRNMNDLAARTLQTAIKEKVLFDDEKKELIYTLGVVLDAMGKKEEAMEQYKQIYEVDINYKDISARVDAFYAGK